MNNFRVSPRLWVSYGVRLSRDCLGRPYVSAEVSLLISSYEGASYSASFQVSDRGLAPYVVAAWVCRWQERGLPGPSAARCSFGVLATAEAP